MLREYALLLAHMDRQQGFVERTTIQATQVSDNEKALVQKEPIENSPVETYEHLDTDSHSNIQRSP